jgi:GTPase involved in cell partitioning and DNA repair
MMEDASPSSGLGKRYLEHFERARRRTRGAHIWWLLHPLNLDHFERIVSSAELDIELENYQTDLTYTITAMLRLTVVESIELEL